MIVQPAVLRESIGAAFNSTRSKKHSACGEKRAICTATKRSDSGVPYWAGAMFIGCLREPESAL